jgi:DNA topoisomerase-1
VRDEGLERSEITGLGIERQHRGRGFRYLGPRGAPVTDAATLSRIKALVIPPAWEDVYHLPRSRRPHPGSGH